MINLWKKYSFELVLGLSVIFLFFYFILRKGVKGTFDTSYLVYKNNKPSVFETLKYYFNLGNEFGNSSKNNKGKQIKNYNQQGYVLNNSFKPSNESFGETETRRCLESLFKKPFPKSRPSFLNNDVTGKKLEIDCYNEELGICVEYQGQQHYKFTPRFHLNKDQFETQKYRDLMKKQKILERNLKYIEVPYTVKIENIEDYLINELRNQNLLG